MLADAILVAVPGADLPPPTPHTNAEPDTPQAPAAVPGAKVPPPIPHAKAEPHTPQALTAVPGADLPPPTRHAKAEPDTLERIWAVSDQGSEAERWARAVGSGPPDLPLAEVTTPEWGDAPLTRPHPSCDDRGLTIERPQLAGRGGLGGRPGPAPDPPSAPQSGRRRQVAVVVGIASLVALTGATATLASRDDSPPRVAGVASLLPPGCPRVPAPVADIDGDGCPDALTVDGAVVTAGDAQWTLGEPGDQVALGDWDCDGSASAALLRPPTGDVFVFPSWAELGAPVSATPIQRVANAVAIRTQPGSPACDTLVVDRASGPPRTIEVPR